MPRPLVVLCAVVLATPLNAQPTVQQFKPLVEWKDTVATCADFNAGLKVGERGYSLRFGRADSSNRVVSAVWDSTGSLQRYSDARGDLRPRFIAGSNLGQHTAISIDLDRRIALLANYDYGEHGANVLIAASVALEDSTLGPPRRLLARLHEQCGAPAVKR